MPEVPRLSHGEGTTAQPWYLSHGTLISPVGVPCHMHSTLIQSKSLGKKPHQETRPWETPWVSCFLSQQALTSRNPGTLKFPGFFVICRSSILFKKPGCGAGWEAVLNTRTSNQQNSNVSGRNRGCPEILCFSTSGHCAEVDRCNAKAKKPRDPGQNKWFLDLGPLQHV